MSVDIYKRAKRAYIFGWISSWSIAIALASCVFYFWMQNESIIILAVFLTLISIIYCYLWHRNKFEVDVFRRRYMQVCEHRNLAENLAIEHVNKNYASSAIMTAYQIINEAIEKIAEFHSYNQNTSTVSKKYLISEEFFSGHGNHYSINRARLSKIQKSIGSSEYFARIFDDKNKKIKISKKC